MTRFKIDPNARNGRKSKRIRGLMTPIKAKKCDECFEKKEDVKKREYEGVVVMLCDECYEQNIGHGQQEKSSSSLEK